jgi:alpha-glucosidase
VTGSSVCFLLDYIAVADVITNYSAAGIPLETMWTDIGKLCLLCPVLMHQFTICALDYMYQRRIFTMDPQYFPTDRMREIISYLHQHGQRYGMFLI